MTPSQVIDTTVPPLLYAYEDISDPLGARPAPPTERARVARRFGVKRPIPEMVGATDQPLTLRGEAATTTLPVGKPTGPARSIRSGAEAGALRRRIFLNIENITGAGNPGSYSIYLNLPPGADPDDHRELRAGQLPMFGVEESTDATRDHPGNGLYYTLEI